MAGSINNQNNIDPDDWKTEKDINEEFLCLKSKYMRKELTLRLLLFPPLVFYSLQKKLRTEYMIVLFFGDLFACLTKLCYFPELH